MQTNQLGLVPLRNFADLGNNIYRSAQPIYNYEYKWLKNKLGINTIINLRSEINIDTKSDLDTISFDVDDHKCPTENDAIQFIKIITSEIANGRKVLFHCEHGHGRTSTFCVLHRLGQGWTLDKALEEETNLGYEFKHTKQLEFLKGFYKKYFYQLKQ